ncbi:mpv17-like protein [Cetorhinus maximus]
MSAMEGKQDILAVWREKFGKTYKVAVIYWPVVQIINYRLVPVFFRMAFFGCWGFLVTFAIFQSNGTFPESREFWKIKTNTSTISWATSFKTLE